MSKSTVLGLLTLLAVTCGCEEQTQTTQLSSATAPTTKAPASVGLTKADCRPEEKRVLDPNRVFFLGGNMGGNDLYVSHNGGKSFDQKISRPPQDWDWDPMIPSAPTRPWNRHLTGEPGELVVSNADRWYVGSDDGLSISSDHGRTFNHLQFPLEINGIRFRNPVSRITILEDSSLLAHAAGNILHLRADGKLIREIKLPPNHSDPKPNRRFVDFGADSEGRLIALVSESAPRGPSTYRLYVSNNCGQTFQRQGSNTFEVGAPHMGGLKVYDNGLIVVISRYGLYISRDNGIGFQELFQTPDGTELGMPPRRTEARSRVTKGNDFIYLGTANGLAQIDLNSPTLNTQILRFNMHPGYTFVSDERAIGGKYTETVYPDAYHIYSVDYSETLGLVFSNYGIVQARDAYNFSTISQRYFDGLVVIK